MKIVRLTGGLGNQLFQYAFGFAIQHTQVNEEVKYDCSVYEREGEDISQEGLELERIFSIQLNKATEADFQKILQEKNKPIRKTLRRIHPYYNMQLDEANPRFRSNTQVRGAYYPWAVRMKQDVQYFGYWQSEKYFQPFSDELRATLNFPMTDDIRINELISELNTLDNSVSIHIRRGDYHENEEYRTRFDFLDIRYYCRAIEYIRAKVKNPRFYIFSNDIPWCREFLQEYNEKIDISYVDFLNDKENYFFTIDAMSHCTHNIIAHSTFSWWAAWLNKNQEKIVVSPDRWFGDVSQKINKKILKIKVPKSWVRLPVN